MIYADKKTAGYSGRERYVEGYFWMKCVPHKKMFFLLQQFSPLKVLKALYNLVIITQSLI